MQLPHIKDVIWTQAIHEWPVLERISTPAPTGADAPDRVISYNTLRWACVIAAAATPHLARFAVRSAHALAEMDPKLGPTLPLILTLGGDLTPDDIPEDAWLTWLRLDRRSVTWPRHWPLSWRFPI